MKIKIIYSIAALLVILFSGCKKEDSFLNTTPNEALSTLSTVQDLKLLLNSNGIFNTKDPALGEISSGEFYVTDNTWNNLSTTERNAYIWAKNIYDAGADDPDWSGPYQQVYYANTILDALSKINVSPADQGVADLVRGSALFYRSIAFYNLVQTFALPYDSSGSKTDLGIPLRLSSDPNGKSVRATVRECYDRIIADTKSAVGLLPPSSADLTQPSAAAADALLARTYLATWDYSDAFQYADACLKISSELVDYNTLNPGEYALSTTFLPEDIFHVFSVPYGITYTYYKSITDTVLYSLYDDNDLRKSLFFIIDGGRPYFRGTYDYKEYAYSGIATDELYLMRAECYARLGNAAAAMADLNTLLATRWKSGTFVAFTATDADDALSKILVERRKELLYRGLRWTDLRRLNKDNRFATTLTRTVKGTAYTLPPGDPRYALPIPDNEIEFSGIPQNAR